jgi:hypothetical protein
MPTESVFTPIEHSFITKKRSLIPINRCFVILAVVLFSEEMVLAIDASFHRSEARFLEQKETFLPGIETLYWLIQLMHIRA